MMQQGNPGRGNLIKVRPRITNTQISRGRTAFISDHNGEAHRKHAIEGLYIYDTRVLSRYAWRIDGKEPQYSCGSPIEQFNWMGYFIQAPRNCKDTPTHECDPLQQTLELRLTRSVGEGMHEDVSLTNHTQIETEVLLELEYEYAFVSQDEVEKGRKQFGKLELKWSEPEPGVWEQMADYHAEHHYSHQGNKGVAKLHRGVKLRIENATSAPERDDERLRFRIHLAAHGEWRVCLSWMAIVDGAVLPLAAQCSVVDASDWDQRRSRLLQAQTAFNPFSYHRGSVWPVTNAGFILGFSRYGLHGEMHQLAKAIFDAARLFEHNRLPEVVAGHQRTPKHPFPGMYVRADWPQAWSASAPFLIIQALLGIYPYAPAKLLFIDPHLPEWLPEITVEGLRVGQASVTLRFRRDAEGRTGYEKRDLSGTLHDVRQPSPWSLTTGWAERTRDMVESFVPHRLAS